MKTTITVDYEHNCETWWNAARAEAKGNPPPACVGLLNWTNELTVSNEDADEFIAWASKLDGWNESPFVIDRIDQPQDPITIIVTTCGGTNSSLLGDAYSAYDGVSWRNSVDNCDSDGSGRVFLDCDSDESADYVCEQLDLDDRVISYAIA